MRSFSLRFKIYIYIHKKIPFKDYVLLRKCQITGKTIPIVSTIGMESSIEKGSISTGIIYPGGVTGQYISSCSAVTCSNVMWEGGGGRLVVHFYRPFV